MDVLEKIVLYKKEELAAKRRKIPLKDLEKKRRDMEPPLPFLQNFKKDEINIIAEVKKASPSAGVLRAHYHPVELAQILEEGGAAALSVLTDGHFFQGNLSDLSAVKKGVKLPCLRKDFTVDEYQIYEARAHGADAVLLIAATLDGFQLADYKTLIYELGMESLVEIHNEEELNRILKHHIKLLGINNRNLKTLKTDTKTSEDLIPKIPSSVQIISESGLSNHDILNRLKQLGCHGFLIGEAFMRIEGLTEMKTELQRLRGK